MNKFPLTKEYFPESIVTWFSDYATPDEVRKACIREFIEQQGAKSSEESLVGNFAAILNKSGLPWLPLDIQFPHEKMAQEAKAVRDLFVSHRSGTKDGGYINGNKGWAALALHGISATNTQSYNMYGYKSEKEVPYQWTEIAERCPVTTSFFKNIYPCDTYYRVRYTIIEPGGFIYPHTDRKESALWEVNLALQNPQGFYFKLAHGGYIPFENGKAFILDVSHEHAVVNLSDEERIHMIVHGYPLRNVRFQNLISSSYEKMMQRPELFWKTTIS